MPDEDEIFGGALVLDFKKRWRHVKTIYSSDFLWALPLCYRVTLLCMRSREKREACSERAVLEFNDSTKLNLL